MLSIGLGLSSSVARIDHTTPLYSMDTTVCPLGHPLNKLPPVYTGKYSFMGDVRSERVSCEAERLESGGYPTTFQDLWQPPKR